MIEIPTLYIMGDQDYMFLPSVKKAIQFDPSSSLLILKNCGHVVNIEKPEKFNYGMMKFINN